MGRNLQDLFKDVQEDINKGLYKNALKKLGERSHEVSKASKFDTSKFHVLKANCLLRLGRFKECFDTINTGLKRSPTDPALLFEKANYYFMVRNYSAARNIYKGLTEFNFKPNMLKNWQGYIYCLIKEEQYEEAVECYNKLINVSGYKFKPEERQKLRHGLANCYREMGDYPAAMRLYSELIALDSNEIKYLE